MERLDGAFAALADPVRRSVLLRLTSGPAGAGELARPFTVSRPAVSRHLRVLREAGLVTVRRQGRSQVYALAPERLGATRAWLEEADKRWQAALNSFKQHVESTDR